MRNSTLNAVTASFAAVAMIVSLGTSPALARGGGGGGGMGAFHGGGGFHSGPAVFTRVEPGTADSTATAATSAVTTIVC